VVSSVVGLDIGRDRLRAVEVVNADKARPTVVRVAELALPDGAVRSGEVRELHTVSEGIKKLWIAGGFKSKKVILGMGNNRVLARDFTVPKAGIEQIRESLPFHVQDILPVPVGDALLDFYPVSEGVGENGPVVHGLLIAAIKESVLTNVNAVRQAGLSPVQVDLVPFALTRVLVRSRATTGAVALIDIGASTTHVVVTAGGVPQFVRMIAVGGDDLTRALTTKVELSPDDAEAAKRARGYSGAPVNSALEKRTAEVINENVAELLNSLRNTIAYFVNTRNSEPVEAVVLTGGGARLAGLPEALSALLRIEVVPVLPFDSIDLSPAVARLSADERQDMTVALGLALGSAA
jgi:type IV pilus assembly protein PilM